MPTALDGTPDLFLPWYLLPRAGRSAATPVATPQLPLPTLSALTAAGLLTRPVPPIATLPPPTEWRQEARTTMADITIRLGQAAQGQADGDLRRRWQAALIARYPGPGRAKRIARALGVALNTAESWLATEPAGPSAAVLARAGQVHGAVLVLEVLLPGSPAARDAETVQQLLTLDAKLSELQAALRSALDLPARGGRP